MRDENISIPNFGKYKVYFHQKNTECLVGFEVLTAVSMKIAVFWVVAPCSLVEVYQRFRGPCCLHHQGDRNLHRMFSLQHISRRCQFIQR
jgi:hypothetical protein